MEIIRTLSNFKKTFLEKNKKNLVIYLLTAFYISFFISRLSFKIFVTIKPVFLVGILTYSCLVMLRRPMISSKLTKRKVLVYLAPFLLLLTTIFYREESKLSTLIGCIGYLFFVLISFQVHFRTTFNEQMKALFNSAIIVNIALVLLSSFGFAVYFHSGIEGLNSLGFFRMFESERYVLRLFGLSQGPNFLALYLGIFFIFFNFDIEKIRTYKYLFISNSILILLTHSLSGGIALFSYIFLIFLIASRKKLLFISKSFALLFSVLAPMWIVYKLTERGIVFHVVKNFIKKMSHGSGRYGLYEQAYDNLINNNLFFGNGIFSFRNYYKLTYGRERNLHSTYLDIISDGGLVTFAVFAFSWFFLFRGVETKLKHFTFLIFPMLFFFTLTLHFDVSIVLYVLFFVSYAECLKNTNDSSAIKELKVSD